MVNLNDHADGIKVLIRDRGAKFTTAFAAAGLRAAANRSPGTRRRGHGSR